jgi:hypothetical protein
MGSREWGRWENKRKGRNAEGERERERVEEIDAIEGLPNQVDTHFLSEQFRLKVLTLKPRYRSLVTRINTSTLVIITKSYGYSSDDVSASLPLSNLNYQSFKKVYQVPKPL